MNTHSGPPDEETRVKDAHDEVGRDGALAASHQSKKGKAITGPNAVKGKVREARKEVTGCRGGPPQEQASTRHEQNGDEMVFFWPVKVGE